MVRTRMAPSPTGEDLHIGNVYTALLNYAWAKKNKGHFLLRVEDTDRQRLVDGSEERIIASLSWLGLNYDEGPGKGGPFAPYRQSERLEVYKKHAMELVEKGHAFYCFCTSERLEAMRGVQQAEGLPTLYDGLCKKYSLEEAKEKTKSEPYVVRLNTPEEGETSFNDLLRGEITFENKLIDDQVLLKSDGFPTYHLAVVVDDHLMEISHVVRAEEWISSTPKHVLLYKFFGWDLPVFAHTPILRNPDKSKLSKRKNPVWASWYKEQGYLQEGILNFLALMGWSHPDQKEEFGLEEFINLFDLKDINPVGPIFDIEKLDWLNGVWIRKLSIAELKNRLKEFYKEEKEFLTIFDSKHIDLLIGLAQSRMKKLSEFKNLVENSQKQRVLEEGEKEVAQKLLENLKAIETSNWREDYILVNLKHFRDDNEVSMKTIYFLITGREQGLPLIETMVKIDGRDQTLKNLESRIS